MIDSLLNVFFGCSHKRTTFPITPLRGSQLAADSRRGTYVACLDCGKELNYSWKDMRVSNVVIASSQSSHLSLLNH
jgi:hypothetical protein